MKQIIIFLVFFSSLTFYSCAKSIFLYPGLIEASEEMIKNCKPLGHISETTDPGKIFQFLEINSCKKKIIKQAVTMGATHLVWVYSNNTGAAARIYKCR